MTTRASAGPRAAKGLLLIVALIALAPYAWSPIYRFAEPTHFSGTQLFNPYASRSLVWQRANFHAHGRAWAGLTNGQQPDTAVAQRYRDLGYSVPGVSDYQRIAAHHGVQTFPIYEHGFNITKQHQLAIGAQGVVWFDFPLWQSLSQQQYVIDRVKGKSALVALAHPRTRDAYTAQDLQSLSGYDLIEIANGPFTAVDLWDAALSSGHAVWAIGNDDTHDVLDPKRTAAAWNMVGAPTPSIDDVVTALRAGRSYAVLRTGTIEASNLTTLDALEVASNTIEVSVRGAPSTFSFIGQDGAVRKTVREATTASYAWTDNDTYVRTEIATPQTQIYLNPVVRYDGAELPAPVARIDAAATWALRGSILLGVVAMVLARRRRPAPVPATRPALAGVKRNGA